MNEEDIIRMAQEAGFDIDEEGRLYFGCGINNEILLKANYQATIIDGIKNLARIAYDKGAKFEREACAQVCEDKWATHDEAEIFAEFIRTRSV